MAREQELSDSELVQRLCAGDRQALDALYARYDAAVLNAARQELRSQPDYDHRARELADLLWLDLSRHGHYLLRHDFARRSLGAYLVDLGRQRARRFLDKLRKKQKAHPEPPLEQDVVDPLPELIERWDEIVELLSAEQLARLRAILATDEPEPIDGAWRNRLIRKLRERLGLPPRRSRWASTRSPKNFPKKSDS